MILQKFFSIPNIAEHQFIVLLVIGYLFSEVISFIKGYLEKHNSCLAKTLGKSRFVRVSFEKFMQEEREANGK